jgi:signal transduction histidine kinase
MTIRTRLVYGVLIAFWGLIVAWQVVEHGRVRKGARAALINRSRDITTTLGLVIRSQRRFGGVVSQERLETALKELVNSEELSAVALLNASREVLVAAGDPIDSAKLGRVETGEYWDSRTVTIVNLVDLGASETREGEEPRRTAVLPPRRESESSRTNSSSESFSNRMMRFSRSFTNRSSSFTNGTNRVRSSRFGDRRRRWRRPPWMNEEEYKSLLETRGQHGLAIAILTTGFHRTCSQDFWMRGIIGCFAGLSVLGLGLAWRTFSKSSELQMRLLRASEMNSHLRELNLAAAGLAHETRNPLNIIRGLAQLISKSKAAPADVLGKSREILDETDRVAAQLNEFINYSRPREVRRSSVDLGSVVGEVVRTLSYDVEERGVQLETSVENFKVEADEQLLRQALFNLLLNATQAVDREGKIRIIARQQGSSEVVLEVLDNGPGIPADQRSEVFKPYFTANEEGTGLGLAVVKQIVLAHGWEIECLANEPAGARFQITHIKLATRT